MNPRAAVGLISLEAYLSLNVYLADVLSRWQRAHAPSADEERGR